MAKSPKKTENVIVSCFHTNTQFVGKEEYGNKHFTIWLNFSLTQLAGNKVEAKLNKVVSKLSLLLTQRFCQQKPAVKRALNSNVGQNGQTRTKKSRRKSTCGWILNNVLSLLLHLIVIHDESQFKKRYLEEEMMIKTEGYLSCSGNSNNNMDEFFFSFFFLTYCRTLGPFFLPFLFEVFCTIAPFKDQTIVKYS